MKFGNFLLILALLKFTECGKVSQQKCEEYKRFAYKTLTCTSSLGGKKRCTKVLECAKSSGLIVGGSAAKKHEFPHFALIGFEENDEISFKCGGSIISENFILSASHCKSTDNNVEASTVRVGEHALDIYNRDKKDYKIQEFIRHAQYNASTFLNDIALIKLKTSIKFNLNVRPACLHQNLTQKLMGHQVTAIGFGALGYGEDSSNILMKVNLTVVHPKRCKGILESTKSQLCIRGHETETGDHGDTCGGDSGGPIQMISKDNYCAFNLIGITSFGKICGLGYGAVYTRISFYLPWIEKTVWSPN